MPKPARRTAYHHGDLKAALVEDAINLIAERGVRGFSMAEVTRHLGVAPSAPYAHFAHRDELLAAVAVRAFQVLHAQMLSELDGESSAGARAAAMSRSYVRFAGTHRALFEVLTQAGVDKTAHPEVAEAERPISALVEESVAALHRQGTGGSDNLATAIEAVAYGHAMLLRDGHFGDGDLAIERAAALAGQTTLALIAGRRAIS